MILRIVRMHFLPEKTNEFLEFFEKNKPIIGSFKGCIELKLFRDLNHPNIFYTHSIWENETYLNDYRNSDFFVKTWKYTKSLFEQKAIAFSLTENFLA